MIGSDSSEPRSLPQALWAWDNNARLSLPKRLLLWLALLVSTCLSSVFFLRDHIPARLLLGGFVASHVLVFCLPSLRLFVMRRGFVSLMHLLCWSPGWIAVIADVEGRRSGAPYQIWSYLLMVVVFLSFLFDFRDAATYLYYLATAKVRS